MPRDGGGRMVKEKNLIVGLDIGTSKIAAIVAEIAADGALNVIGMGTQPSRGLKKGVVVNIDAAGFAVDGQSLWHVSLLKGASSCWVGMGCRALRC